MSLASGICSHTFAINSLLKNNNNEPENPTIEKKAKATLNIFSAPLLSPTDNFSEINFATALGTPIDDIVRSNA